jgi:hypothetical protein
MRLFVLLVALIVATLFDEPLFGQVNDRSLDCNKLGAWLWYIDITGFDTHHQLADSLKKIGVKRIYVKVADGTPNPSVWPELNDAGLVDAYTSRGLEVWAWSYNYPNNPLGQSKALSMAAKTGYQGYVYDIEMEFDGLTTPLSNLCAAFAAERQTAISNGWADSTFQIYCTTWGNPADHNFHLELINPYVDGFMPQTYVAQWGPSYMQNIPFWIAVGNAEYTSLGATRPVHHIVALETDNLSAAQIDTFIAHSGSETSLWRIPGGGVPQSLWSTWHAIRWDADFCPPTTYSRIPAREAFRCFPNPGTERVIFETTHPEGTLTWFDSKGMPVGSYGIQQTQTEIKTDRLPPGLYHFQWRSPTNFQSGTWIKLP